MNIIKVYPTFVYIMLIRSETNKLKDLSNSNDVSQQYKLKKKLCIKLQLRHAKG